MQETKNVFLVSGLSGSGKNWVYEQLKKTGFDVGNIVSYASRKPRNQEEVDNQDYYFLDDNSDLNNKLNDNLQVFYNGGNIYFSTTEEIKNKLDTHDNVYLIMTPPSVKHIVKLLERNIPKYNYNVYYFHLEVNESTRINNMVNRNDEMEEIHKRIRVMDEEIHSAYLTLLESNEYRTNRCSLTMSCLHNDSKSVFKTIVKIIKESLNEEKV